MKLTTPKTLISQLQDIILRYRPKVIWAGPRIINEMRRAFEPSEKIVVNSTPFGGTPFFSVRTFNFDGVDICLNNDLPPDSVIVGTVVKMEQHESDDPRATVQPQSQVEGGAA